MSKRPTHPRPSPSPELNRGRGRPVRRDASTLHEQVREKIKAYPGTTTYIDLIRKNKRDSFLLMLGMIALGVGLGAIIGAVIGGYSGAGANDDPGSLAFYIPSIILGAGVALVVGVLGSVWSYFQGANAILRMVHAKEITPELDAELFNVVDEMRLAAGIPMPKVYLIPESALNAFATGRDPEHGVVAITTGLRAKLNRDELQGVIAHEIAHIRHYDIRFSLLMATMVGLIVMACDIFLRIAFHGGMRSRRSSDKGGGAAVLIMILLAVVLSIVAPILAKFIQMAYSRQREYLADAGAVELTRNPEGLASALSKLAGDEEPLVDLANRGTAHMFIVNPLRKMRKSHQSVKSMFSSHPPVADRIARLMALTR
ncbi:MAG: M48 family metallopeptidase [Phycisphaerales bacterium JB058]